jgi:hypothetical protein
MNYVKLIAMLIGIAALVAGFYFFLGVVLAVAVFALVIWYLSAAAESLWIKLCSKFR